MWTGGGMCGQVVGWVVVVGSMSQHLWGGWVVVIIVIIGKKISNSGGCIAQSHKIINNVLK